MLTEYILRALDRAAYELMENGRFFVTIPGLKGLWADGSTLEECRRNLVDTLEDWLFISLKEGLPIPAIGDLALIPNEDLELADA